jgi:adenylate kinase
MIALEVDREELVNRLVKRGETSGRTDDNAETINKRIVEYENKTRPVAQYYTNQGKFFSIHGIGEIEEIFNHLCTTIDGITAKNEI